eukprot:scaffold99809_cov52-Phaeocystis_antarctica.AAC.1
MHWVSTYMRMHWVRTITSLTRCPALDQARVYKASLERASALAPHPHQVNDLPGLLTSMRRALRPNGLFLAAMLGGDTAWPKSPPLGGHAWRLWAAWHSQGEAGPLRAPPVPRVLEPAASKAADSTTFDPSGDTLSEMYATEGLNPGRAGRVPHRPATHTCAPRLGQALLLRARGLRAQG